MVLHIVFTDVQVHVVDLYNILLYIHVCTCIPPVPIVSPTPTTPGGYRTSDQLLPSMDPVVPTGYFIMV